MGTGPPGFELAYFFSQSVSNEFRLKFERDLLNHYYRELLKAGVKQEEFPWHEMMLSY